MLYAEVVHIYIYIVDRPREMHGNRSHLAEAASSFLYPRGFP